MALGPPQRTAAPSFEELSILGSTGMILRELSRRPLVVALLALLIVSGHAERPSVEETAEVMPDVHTALIKRTRLSSIQDDIARLRAEMNGITSHPVATHVSTEQKQRHEATKQPIIAAVEQVSAKVQKPKVEERKQRHEATKQPIAAVEQLSAKVQNAVLQEQKQRHKETKKPIAAVEQVSAKVPKPKLEATKQPIAAVENVSAKVPKAKLKKADTLDNGVQGKSKTNLVSSPPTRNTIDALEKHANLAKQDVKPEPALIVGPSKATPKGYGLSMVAEEKASVEPSRNDVLKESPPAKQKAFNALKHRGTAAVHAVDLFGGAIKTVSSDAKMTKQSFTNYNGSISNLQKKIDVAKQNSEEWYRNTIGHFNSGDRYRMSPLLALKNTLDAKKLEKFEEMKVLDESETTMA